MMVKTRYIIEYLVASVFTCLLSGCLQSVQSKVSGPQVQDLLYTTFDLSPDEKTIVFSGAGAGGKDLYLMDLPTSKVTQLTNTPEYENSPAFSSDGKAIVYQCAKSLDYPRHLFLRSLDGKYIHQLTNTLGTDDDHPCFSPNGKWIVFARAQRFHNGIRGENTWSNIDVFLINRNGSSLRKLTNLQSQGVIRPKFCPDSRHILYEHTVISTSTFEAQMHIEKLDITGHDPVQEVVHFGTYADASPYPFPDKKRLVFYSNFGGTVDLYCAFLQGGKPHSVLPDQTGTGYIDPVVTRDGKHIYCLGMYGPRLLVMNANGTGLHQIADSSLFSDPMHWKP
jgi:Tol biopolymer transport system component